MKRLLIIFGLASCAVLASAQQDVGSVTFSSTVGSNATAPSMTNTGGNFLFSSAWIACTSTNPNTTNVYQVNGGTANQDSNGNTWNSSIDSTYIFTSTTRALYFFWSVSPINAGANVVTYKNLASDCKVEGGIQNEYAGFYTYNPGSYRVNENFLPFTTPDSNTSFPINANQTYLSDGTSPDLTYVVAIAEGGTAGTWSASGFAQVNTFSASGIQMVAYDANTSGPSTISVGNTGSGFSHALGEWIIFNRVSSTPPRTAPLSGYYPGYGNTTATITPTYQAGDFTVLSAVAGSVPSGQTGTPSGCYPSGTATAYSYSAGVLTVTAANNLVAGQTISIQAASGDALAALNGLNFVVQSAGLSTSQYEILETAVTGSGSTSAVASSWLPLYWPINNGTHGANPNVWIGYNAPAGTCQIQVAAAGSNSGRSIAISAWVFHGLSAWPLDGAPFGDVADSGGDCLTCVLSMTPTIAGDDYLMIAFSSHGFNGVVTCASGSTWATGLVVGNNGLAIGACLTQGNTTSAQTNTLSTTDTNGLAWFKMLLRTQTPTFGVLQSVPCGLNTTTATCTPYFPTQNGDYYLADTGNSKNGNFPNISPSTSAQLLPFENVGQASYIIPITSTIPTAYSFSVSGGVNVMSAQVSEVTGLASSNPYVDGTGAYNFQGVLHGPTVTTWSSGPVHALTSGSYLLHCVLGNISSSTVPQFVNAPSPFALSAYTPMGGGTNATMDAQISTSGAYTTSCSPSWGTAESGPYSGLYVFSAAPYTLPHIVQTSYAGSANPSIAGFFNSVKGGDGIFACASTTTSGSSGPWSWSDTCGGTINSIVNGGCGASGVTSQYCAKYISGITAGSCTVTAQATTSGITALGIAEVTGVTNIQAGNSQTSTTDSVGTGNVTTSNSTTLLLSCGMAGNDTEDSYINDTDTTWTGVQAVYLDNTGTFMFSKTVLTPGTWNNSFIAGSNTVQMAGVIVPATLAPISSAQYLNVTVAGVEHRYELKFYVDYNKWMGTK